MASSCEILPRFSYEIASGGHMIYISGHGGIARLVPSHSHPQHPESNVRTAAQWRPYHHQSKALREKGSTVIWTEAQGKLTHLPLLPLPTPPLRFAKKQKRSPSSTLTFGTFLETRPWTTMHLEVGLVRTLGCEGSFPCCIATADQG